MRHEVEGRVPHLAEVRLLGQLEPLDDALSQLPRAQHLGLGVEELAVPNDAAGADEGVGHVQRRRRGWRHLEQRGRPVLRGLRLAREHPQGEPSQRRREDQQPPPPQQTGVVADIEVLLEQEARLGAFEAGHGSLVSLEASRPDGDDVVGEQDRIRLLSAADRPQVGLEDHACRRWRDR